MQRSATAFGQRIMMQRPAEIIVQPTMRDQRAFRPARRSRGVNDISQVLSTHTARQVLRSLLRDLLPFTIHTDRLPPESGQQVDPLLRAQREGDLRVVEHESQSLEGRL